MKRKTLVILFLCVLFSCMTIGVQNSVAWKNGWGDGSLHSTYAKTINEYSRDYDNAHKYRKTSKYYGTHDWIAERALYLAYSEFPENLFLSMMYLDVSQLKMYYLLGTEFPDSTEGTKVYTYNGELIKTDLNVITRLDFRTCFGQHILRFSGKPDPYVNNLAKYADTMESKVANYLEQEDCKAAAFFLGALAHYVADAVCIPHLIDDFNHNHKSWEDWVQSLTSRKIVDEQYSDGQLTTLDPLYAWRYKGITALEEFQIKKPRYSAKVATINAGYAVHEGFTLDECNMNTYVDLGVDASYYKETWQFPSKYFNLKDPELRWDAWNIIHGPFSSDDHTYLYGIYYHLNIGIYYMASILANVKDWFVKCDGFENDEIVPVLIEAATESALLWLFVILGNAGTILALVTTISKENDILEAAAQIF
ncbi:MAG: zinc dependent phospholipase C family protein [Candidatus Thorarchaeota archaeon]